ncbi:hypothetical protein QR680_019328 [Steinernema hermaphroditum]|uniref:Mitochondrial mRNA-processing protein COX24 C-terminal domain-containing protein n=1 Tax=Steinernema hermaphroditum TaxID=289476 RepID=A0AA39GQR9_9BILA|nr:hypothetical protein QR680_019328 [Steinernema hermaphroditum]
MISRQVLKYGFGTVAARPPLAAVSEEKLSRLLDGLTVDSARYESADEAGLVHHRRNLIQTDSSKFLGARMLWQTGRIGAQLTPTATNDMLLPPSLRSPQIYTFPTLERIQKIEAPAPGNLEPIEKLDPIVQRSPVVDPNAGTVAPMIAAPRLLTIRRKKMKKHKRKKRYDRDYFKYAKYHREKKLRAEREFRARMKDILNELETFNPMDYVNDTIRSAKREWSTKIAPSSKKLYPHWSQLVSLEELYGLEKSDYIDKRAGLPTEEDREQIARLKEEYRKKYIAANVKD